MDNSVFGEYLDLAIELKENNEDERSILSFILAEFNKELLNLLAKDYEWTVLIDEFDFHIWWVFEEFISKKWLFHTKSLFTWKISDLILGKWLNMEEMSFISKIIRLIIETKYQNDHIIQDTDLKEYLKWKNVVFSERVSKYAYLRHFKYLEK